MEATRPAGQHDGAVSDTGPFALIPEWLLELPVTDRAIRAYAFLSRYADDQNGTAWPSRKTLAERMGCHTATVDRACKELVDAGALLIEPRYSGEGDRTSNLYTVLRVQRGLIAHAETGVTNGAGTGVSVDAEGTRATRNESQHERDIERRDTRPYPLKVDRKPVKARDGELGIAVLAEWNQQTGQNLASTSWLVKIIMRVREHPELELDDHAHIIAASLRDPWWKGPATPSVVYGSDAQFERSMLTAQRPSVSDARSVFDIANDELGRVAERRSA